MYRALITASALSLAATAAFATTAAGSGQGSASGSASAGGHRVEASGSIAVQLKGSFKPQVLQCASRPLDTEASPNRHPALPFSSLEVLGLTTDGRLVCFHEALPGHVRVLATVNGLQVDTQVLAIDHRAADGALYGLGNAGGVYRIDPATGVATLSNRLTVALQGTRVAADFNPAADRLRIVTNTGQNLRHNVDAGGTTATDAPLNYTAGTTASGVVAAAYINNDVSPAAAPTNAAATATALFVIDANLDQVALQSPPNAGVLVATGKLQQDVGEFTGFDIFSTVQGGVTTDNRALATTTAADGQTTLHSVNLLTGKLSAKGKLATGISLVDIAIPHGQR
ncbi:DUF4394 domain-containing protein [Aquabacterium lacunae]|uniref:DUF4394 domain-containing protein n=1 Tax=Aquabacterium lacunae TaxID=2528630 RepID=A0A4Q9H4A5_9BURK|nr:DUF4394 domain-containing protein [Aquabacterium lacunae]TBO32835.1 DUF4394 domain-containing protein [Aquabacterium lacunae]